MRIFIAGQPKTGNVWARNLLATIYDLVDLNIQAAKVPRNAIEFGEFVEAGLFLDGSILHQHLNPKPEVLDGCSAIGCHIVTVLRNPYDAFVSYYFYINRSQEKFTGKPAGVLVDKPIDHPDVMWFLKHIYGQHLLMASRWAAGGRAIVLRYEDLHRSPLETLRTVTGRIEPASDCRMERAIEACSASALRKRGGWLKNHIRVAGTGDGRKHLQPVHLEEFRRSYASLVESLGYTVL